MQGAKEVFCHLANAWLEQYVYSMCVKHSSHKHQSIPSVHVAFTKSLAKTERGMRAIPVQVYVEHLELC